MTLYLCISLFILQSLRYYWELTWLYHQVCQTWSINVCVTRSPSFVCVTKLANLSKSLAVSGRRASHRGRSFTVTLQNLQKSAFLKLERDNEKFISNINYNITLTGPVFYREGGRDVNKKINKWLQNNTWKTDVIFQTTTAEREQHGASPVAVYFAHWCRTTKPPSPQQQRRADTRPSDPAPPATWSKELNLGHISEHRPRRLLLLLLLPLLLLVLFGMHTRELLLGSPQCIPSCVDAAMY